MHKFFQQLVPLCWTFILCCLVALTCSAVPSSAYNGSAGKDPLTPEISGQIPLAVDVPSSAKTPEEARPFFDHFSWQSFIALNWPAKPGKRGQPYRPNKSKVFLKQPQGAQPVVWGTYREAFDLFNQGQDRPVAWNADAQPKNSPCPNAKPGQKVFVMASKVGTVLDEVDQAFSFPLIDQHKNFASYEVRFDKAQYNFVRGSDNEPTSWLYLVKNLAKAQGDNGLQMPVSTTQPRQLGALMLKAGWRQMTDKDDLSRYYVVQAQVYDPTSKTCQEQSMGLVGLHVVQKLENFPEWIWSTFEQVDNVPGTDDSGSVPASFSFNNGTRFPKTVGGYANKPTYKASDMPAKDARVPVQVTRLNAIPPSTEETNARYQKALKNTVWQYYQLVFTQWPADASNFLLMEEGGIYPQDAGGAFPVNGVTNAALETYFQSQDDAAGAGGNSCMSCHYRAGQSDFSWVLQLRAHEDRSKSQ